MTDVQETLNEVYRLMRVAKVHKPIRRSVIEEAEARITHRSLGQWHPLHDLWIHKDGNGIDDGLTVECSYRWFDWGNGVLQGHPPFDRDKVDQWSNYVGRHPERCTCHGTGRVVRDVSGLPESMVLGWLARLIGLGHLQDFEITEDGNEPVVFAKALLAAVQQELGVEAQS